MILFNVGMLGIMILSLIETTSFMNWLMKGKLW